MVLPPPPLRGRRGAGPRGRPRRRHRAHWQGARHDESVSAKQSQSGADRGVPRRRHARGRESPRRPEHFCETKPIRPGPRGPTMATRQGPRQHLLRSRPSQSTGRERLVAMSRAVAAGATERTGKEHETVRAFLRNKANSARAKGSSQDGDTAGAERARGRAQGRARARSGAWAPPAGWDPAGGCRRGARPEGRRGASKSPVPAREHGDERRTSGVGGGRRKLSGNDLWRCLAPQSPVARPRRRHRAHCKGVRGDGNVSAKQSQLGAAQGLFPRWRHGRAEREGATARQG